MYKEILLVLGLSLGIVLISNQQMLKAAIVDSATTEQYIPFHWEAISDVDKILQHENIKDLNKRAIDQSKIGNDHYEIAIKKMRNKDYLVAIAEFKNAMKRYKRAKLGPDAYNYLHTNNINFKLRELYGIYYFDLGEISFGKRMFTLGSVDENSPIDHFNPYNYYYLLMGGTEKKIGVNAIYFELYLENGWNNFSPLVCALFPPLGLFIDGEFSLRKKMSVMFLGSAVGFLVGLTSVEAGTIILIGLLLLFQLPVGMIVGTTMLNAAVLQGVAGLGHFSLGNVQLDLLASLLMGSFPGAVIGSRMVNLIPERWLRLILVMTVLISGLAMLGKYGL